MAEIQENPILMFFSNLLRGIKLPFPPKKNDAEIEPAGVASEVEPIKIKSAVSEEESVKPAFVKFPRQGFASLKLEAEDYEAESNTNPILLWQVYAIGGFFILKWAWTRWNERKGQKPRPDGDDL